MNNQEEQNEIRVTVEQAEQAVESYRALVRLMDNPDYKLVIDTLYLEEQALNQMSLLAHEDMKSKRDDIIEDLVAKSTLKLFLRTILSKGVMFEEDLIAYREAQQELQEEDNE